MTWKAARWGVATQKKETTFATALADGILVDWYEVTEPVFHNVEREYRNDAGTINGQLGATDDEIETQMATLPIKAQASTELATWLLALLFGRITTTGASDPFTHTLKAREICTLNPPSTSVLRGYACAGETATQDGHKGISVDSVSLTCSGKGAIELDATLKSDGSITDKSGATLPATLKTVTKLLGAHTVLKYGPLGTENITSVIRSWKLTASGGLFVPPSITAGKFVPEFHYGPENPTIDFEFTMKGDTSHVVYGYFEANTSCILDLTIDSGVTPSRSLRALLSKTKVDSTEAKEGSERRLNNKLRVFANSTDGGYGQIIAKTGESAYLVAA
jgi:hypothetical protein